MFAKLFPSRRTSKQKPNRRVCLLQVENLETRLAPAFVDWISNANGNWQDCGSWRERGSNPPVFRCPGAGDDAVIDVAIEARITFSAATGTQTVRSLSTSEILNMTGGTLNLSSAAPLTSSIRILEQSAGATLNVGATTTLNLPATHRLNGAINVASGGVLNIASFTMNGTINAAASANVNWSGCGDMELNPGASLTGAGTYTLLGNVFCGPQLSLNTPVTVQNFELNGNGGIDGDAAFTVTNTFTWRSGTLGGTGTVTIPSGATLDLIEHHTKTLNVRTLNNSGTANWTTPQATLGLQNSVFNNLATGTVHVRNDTSFIYANGTFNNAGTFNKTLLQAPGRATVNARFTNTGTVNVLSGILQFFAATTTSGAIQAAAGTTVELFYSNNIGPFTVNAGATFTGAGTFHLLGNQNGRVILNTNVTIPNFILDDAQIEGTGSFTPSGPMAWNGGGFTGSGTVTIPAGVTLTLGGNVDKYLDGTRVLNNLGTINFDSTRRFGIGQGAVFNNSGTFNIQGSAGIDSWLYDFSPPGTITNTGTWTKSSAGATTINVIFNTSVPVAVNAGELRLQRGGTSTAAFNTAAGAVLAITGGVYNFNAGTTIAGGQLRISGGTLNLNTNVTVANCTLEGNGTLTGTSNLTVTQRLDWTRGTMASSGTTIIPAGATLAISGNDAKILQDTRTLEVAGTGTWSDGGDINLNGVGTTFRITGSLTVENDRFFLSNGRVINQGTLTKTSFGMSRIDSVFENRGRTHVASGELQLRSGVSSGTFDLGAAGILRFVSNTYQLQAGATLQGDGFAIIDGANVEVVQGATVNAYFLALRSGTLLGGGTLNVTGYLDWSGGNMSDTAGITRLAAGSYLSINGNAGKQISGRRLELDGYTSWIESSSIGLGSNATIEVTANGYFEIYHTTDQAFTGQGFFNNAGLFLKFGPAQTTFASGITFNDNGGYLGIYEGVMNVAGRYIVNNGGYTDIYSTLIAGQGMEIRGGYVSLSGGQITGNVSLTEVDAFLFGYGAITGNLTNGGLIFLGGFGDSPGQLLVGGDFTQSALGYLDIEVGGPNAGQSDQLRVIGRATLGGTLNIGLIGAYQPNTGDSIRVLQVAGGILNNSRFAVISGFSLDPRYDANGLSLVKL